MSRGALFNPRHEDRRRIGRALAEAFPVDPNTPPDMLKMLERAK